MHSKPDIIVVGAGIIGIATSLRLQLAGMQVLLLDGDPPAQGASFGNAGGLAISEVIPLAEPGVWKKIPSWLMNPLGPLAVRWRHLPYLANWLCQFALASRPEKAHEYAKQLSWLLSRATDDFSHLSDLANTANLWRRNGALALYDQKSMLDQDMPRWAYRESLGVNIKRLIDEPELHREEPLINAPWLHAMLLPDWSHVDDPYSYAKGVFDCFLAQGGSFQQHKVTQLNTYHAKINGVTLSDGTKIHCPKVLVTAGAWSNPLVKKTGMHVPLVCERGYHLTLPHADKPLRKFLLNVPDSFVILPMSNGGIRLAGTVELAKPSAKPDYRRSYILLEKAESIIGKINKKEMSAWMGSRPSVPETVPVIGASSKTNGLYLATGHGHLGLTLAGTTAKLLHDLILFEKNPPAFLHPERYSNSYSKEGHM